MLVLPPSFLQVSSRAGQTRTSATTAAAILQDIFTAEEHMSGDKWGLSGIGATVAHYTSQVLSSGTILEIGKESGAFHRLLDWASSFPLCLRLLAFSPILACTSCLTYDRPRRSQVLRLPLYPLC